MSLAEVVMKVECYIKGEENNIENNAKDEKEHTFNIDRSLQSWRNHKTLPIRDKTTLR